MRRMYSERNRSSGSKWMNRRAGTLAKMCGSTYLHMLICALLVFRLEHSIFLLFSFAHWLQMTCIYRHMARVLLSWSEQSEHDERQGRQTAVLNGLHLRQCCTACQRLSDVHRGRCRYGHLSQQILSPLHFYSSSRATVW